ncbi:hypothetical protein PybrP1_007011, partial [[Pythium] brassicae (nom. inval.)]
MTDTSPLAQIKEALKLLSAEIRHVDLRISVVSHTLLQAKSRQASAAFRGKGKAGDAHKVTDTSPLARIKEALKLLSTEIKHVDLRIGVVSHTLLQAKSRQASAAFRGKGKAGDAQCSGISTGLPVPWERLQMRTIAWEELRVRQATRVQSVRRLATGWCFVDVPSTVGTTRGLQRGAPYAQSGVWKLIEDLKLPVL